LLSILAGSASAAELLINGGFETGAFTGWTVVDRLPFGTQYKPTVAVAGSGDAGVFHSP
jgi:hypothetical protein